MAWYAAVQGRPRRPRFVSASSSLSVVQTISHVPQRSGELAGSAVGVRAASRSERSRTRRRSSAPASAPSDCPPHASSSCALSRLRSAARASGASGEGRPAGAREDSEGVARVSTKRYESAASPSSRESRPRSRAVERPPSTPARTRRVSSSVYVRSHVRSVPGGKATGGRRRPRMEKVIVWKATRSARGPLGSKVAVNWTKRAAPRSESSFVYVRLGTSTRWKAAPRTGPSAPLLGGGALL
mmetsp:Transcript_13942/g.41242  ORF Transcript_13942/g.41242 Transcript_13942/m.41242 type:complete len:242 (+) Transcript_13942:347-1072(+)